LILSKPAGFEFEDFGVVTVGGLVAADAAYPGADGCDRFLHRLNFAQETAQVGVLLVEFAAKTGRGSFATVYRGTGFGCEG
jgi:hypothetical protein